jgi:hypothetical protein
VVSNIRNIISFKANRQDATMLSSIMEIKIEESFKKARSQTELEESKKEMFVRLHQRECIVRLFDGTKYILPMKLKVVNVNRWGYKEVKPPEPKAHPALVKGGKKPGAEIEEQMEQEPPAEHEEQAQVEQSQSPVSQSAPADWSSFKMDERMGSKEEKPEQEKETETASEEPEEEQMEEEEGTSAKEKSPSHEESEGASDEEKPASHLSVMEQLRRARAELKSGKK